MHKMSYFLLGPKTCHCAPFPFDLSCFSSLFMGIITPPIDFLTAVLMLTILQNQAYFYSKGFHGPWQPKEGG